VEPINSADNPALFESPLLRGQPDGLVRDSVEMASAGFYCDGFGIISSGVALIGEFSEVRQHAFKES
jgi:hypothetical protein